MEVSLKLIEEKGVRALTLREIGARLGVSRMAPYRHFADKAALLAALAVTGFQEFGAALEQARQNAPQSFLAQLDAMSIAYVRFASGHRAHFEVMFGSGGEPLQLDAAGSKIADAAFHILADTVARGQQAGEIVDGDPVALARLLWSLVHGISTLGLEPVAGERQNGAFTLFCSRTVQTGIQKSSASASAGSRKTLKAAKS